MTAATESIDEYLARHHIITYLEDAVQQLLEYKDENPKVVPTKFFFEYFTNLKQGSHILFRDYQFIKSTPHNRSSFLSLFLRCFRHIGKRGELLTIAEYSSLLRLLCSDFPLDMVQKTATIILPDDGLNSHVSFSDFIYGFQIQFYYEEFVGKCREVYESLLGSHAKEAVVVPTSETPAVDVAMPTSSTTSPVATALGDKEKNSSSKEEAAQTDTVDSLHLYKLLCPIMEKAVCCSPSTKSLHQVLKQTRRVSLHGLLMAMSKCDVINEEIGILPSRDLLYLGLEEEVVEKLLTPEAGTSQSSIETQPAVAVASTSSDSVGASASASAPERPPPRARAAEPPLDDKAAKKNGPKSKNPPQPPPTIELRGVTSRRSSSDDDEEEDENCYSSTDSSND